MALIKNNAKVAAQIAVELAKIQKNDYGDDKSIFTSFPASQSKSLASSKTPLVIGGSILDIHYHVEEKNLEVSKPFFFLLINFFTRHVWDENAKSVFTCHRFMQEKNLINFFSLKLFSLLCSFNENSSMMVTTWDVVNKLSAAVSA